MPHIPELCSVRTCMEEATTWFDSSLLFGRDYPRDTFYLCPDHADKLSAYGSFIYWLDPKTELMRNVELAVYQCRDGCAVCD